MGTWPTSPSFMKNNDLLCVFLKLIHQIIQYLTIQQHTGNSGLVEVKLYYVFLLLLILKLKIKFRLKEMMHKVFIQTNELFFFFFLVRTITKYTENLFFFFVDFFTFIRQSIYRTFTYPPLQVLSIKACDQST